MSDAAGERSTADLKPGPAAWQRRLYVVIFEHDTVAGKAFDVVLLVAIVVSVAVVMMASVRGFAAEHRRLLLGLEWGFTALFTVEYGLRLACIRDRRAYVLSFFGLVDLLAILPTYLGVFVTNAQGLATVRGLRLLRIFRILKLTQFVSEASALRATLWASRAKLVVFLMTVLIVACIVGAGMYVVEGPTNPKFSSIPQSIYWAIVTMATVGYGDIVPITTLGKGLSVLLIVFGFSLIVVPTGILSAEFSETRGKAKAEAAVRPCPACGKAGHDADAAFCKACGGPL